MAEKKTATWKLALGYTAFSLFAVIAALLLTFPYDTAKERLRQEADSAGYTLRIGSIGPGFFAVRATDLQISKKVDPPGDKPPEALKIDSLTLGPTLFPPGAGLSMKALGGKISGRVSGLSTMQVKLDVDEVDLSQGNLKGYSGIDFSGKVDAHVDLSLPRSAVGNEAPQPDLALATGTVSLETKGVAVNGGTVTIAIPQFGPEPTPVDLPKIVLGDLTANLKFDKGAGTVDEFHSKSADLESNATGTLKLAKRIEYAEPAIELRFKPDPEFQKRLGLIGSALSMVGADPKDPSWRLGHLTGYVGRPQFR